MALLVLLISLPIWARFAASVMGVVDVVGVVGATPAAFRRLALDGAVLSVWLAMAFGHLGAVISAAVLISVAALAGHYGMRIATWWQRRSRML